MMKDYVRDYTPELTCTEYIRLMIHDMHRIADERLPQDNHPAIVATRATMLTFSAHIASILEHPDSEHEARLIEAIAGVKGNLDQHELVDSIGPDTPIKDVVIATAKHALVDLESIITRLQLARMEVA